MDGKVSLSIREIENGYIVDRSWDEKRKDGDGRDYKSEQVYYESLPAELEKLFKPGKVLDDEQADNGEKSPKSFDDAEQKSMKRFGK